MNIILSCSTQLNMKFILPINVKMPFMGRINTCTSSESFKARKIFFSSFKFLQAIEISCSVELSMKKVYKFGAWAFEPYSCMCEQCRLVRMLRLSENKLVSYAPTLYSIGYF